VLDQILSGNPLDEVIEKIQVYLHQGKGREGGYHD